MTDREKTAVGIDIGTSRIVVATRDGKEFRCQSQLNSFLTIPFSKVTRMALEREKIPHAVEGAEMTVLGNESEKLARLFQRETRRPMTRGLLNPAEAGSAAMIRQIVESLIDRTSKEARQICFSVPGAPVGMSGDLTYHEATLRQILQEFGEQVTSINEGLAVILAELEDSNYTGIGISCGGGMCNICLAYLSVPIVSFSIAKGGDFIDSSVASVTGETATAIRWVKEQSFELNGHFADRVKQALSVYHEDLIRSIISALREALSDSKNVPPFTRPVPMVISGGSAVPPGFRDRFEKLLGEDPLPISLSGIRLAPEPLDSTAKGALVAALAEI